MSSKPMTDVAAFQILGPRKRQEDAALVASDKPFRAHSIAAEFYVAEIELHPAARLVHSSKLVLVGSDGLDVLEDPDTPGGWVERVPTPEWARTSAVYEEHTRGRAEWKQMFDEMNPREILSHVESVLTAAVATDNTTAIALRPPKYYTRPDDEYLPVPDAPEREVLGGVSI